MCGGENIFSSTTFIKYNHEKNLDFTKLIHVLDKYSSQIQIDKNSYNHLLDKSYSGEFSFIFTLNCESEEEHNQIKKEIGIVLKKMGYHVTNQYWHHGSV